MTFGLIQKIYDSRAWAPLAKSSRGIENFLMASCEAEPIIILGNQKTGSTAIAALLSQATENAVTLDLQSAIQDVGWQLCVKYGVTDFNDIAYKYKKDFSRKIIKEPSLTYFYQELTDLFPKAKFVFIQRNPYQNIRSILNRLRIPGDLRTIEYDDWSELRRIPIWRLTMDSSWLGRPKGNYIEGMAHRWDIAAKTYLDSRSNFMLVRYEDFLRDKKFAIESLASKLNLKIYRNIDAAVDFQYQPKGYAEVPISEFFGSENLAIIKNICSESANKLGYKL